MCVCVCTHMKWCNLLRFEGQYYRGEMWFFSFLIFFILIFFSLPSKNSLTHLRKAVLLISFPVLVFKP